MAQLSKRERVDAALKGEAVDRVPVSAWRTDLHYSVVLVRRISLVPVAVCRGSGDVVYRSGSGGASCRH